MIYIDRFKDRFLKKLDINLGLLKWQQHREIH